MISLSHLPRVEALSLSQEFETISARFLALKSSYLLYFTQKQIDIEIANQEME